MSVAALQVPLSLVTQVERLSSTPVVKDSETEPEASTVPKSLLRIGPVMWSVPERGSYFSDCPPVGPALVTSDRAP